MRGRVRGLALAGVLAVAALSGCTGNAASGVHAQVTVTPQSAVADVPVSVRVSGLPAGKTVTITTRAQDGKTPWTASAKFTVPANGVVTLGMRSTGGSYTGVEPMGLFEFMAPPKGSSPTLPNEVFAPFLAGKSFRMTLQAELDNRVVGSTTATRLAVAPGVTVKRLRPDADGIYGDLYRPAGPVDRKPAVLVFGGTEGGLSTGPLAAQLASHGYPALALAYFAEPGLPRTLSDIPLEYFAKALRILRTQPDVDPRHVVVVGDSRGSEAALLVGAHFPRLVNAVVAGSPSSVVNASYPAMGTVDHSSWSLHGKGLPYVPFNMYDGTTPAATIPVEKIDGPLLLVCGTDDTIWPSCEHQDDIVERLQSHHFTHPVTNLQYPNAGHNVGAMLAYFSSTQAFYSQVHSERALGGTLRAEKVAEAAAHRALLKFLAAQG